jgi:hypothetical protein
MNALSAFLFESSPYPPFLSAWLVGFCEVGFDGQVYRTLAGDEYLDGLASPSCSWSAPSSSWSGFGLVGAVPA